jgi:hypothetical protein
LLLKGFYHLSQTPPRNYRSLFYCYDEWAARFQIWKKAFGDLLETLNRASSEPTERGRYIVELTALATFVSTFNKPNGAHIFELASKLNDLDFGRDDPIFLRADVKDHHPHPDKGSQWQARAHYVVAVEALILTGKKQRWNMLQTLTAEPTRLIADLRVA